MTVMLRIKPQFITHYLNCDSPAHGTNHTNNFILLPNLKLAKGQSFTVEVK